jgi:hypothetical protein
MQMFYELKMMKKISTTLGALAVALSLNSCGNEEQKPVQSTTTTIEHTLQITPTENYDKEFAEKLLKLAKLTVTKPKGEYELLLFDEQNGAKANAIYVSFEENGNKYQITIGDYDEKELEGIVSTPEQPIADGIRLEKLSSENEKDNRYFRVSNLRIDGNTFEGLTYVSDKSADEESFLPRDLKEYFCLDENKEHQPFFDQEFRNLVDELLEIYQRE